MQPLPYPATLPAHDRARWDRLNAILITDARNACARHLSVRHVFECAKIYAGRHNYSLAAMNAETAQRMAIDPRWLLFADRLPFVPGIDEWMLGLYRAALQAAHPYTPPPVEPVKLAIFIDAALAATDKEVDAI